MSNNIVPLADIERMAQIAAISKMFGFKTKEEAMAIMLLCQAEDMHPAIALRDYNVIQGRPALKADAMLARFQAAGGHVKWHELSNTKVSGTFSHKAGGDATITWTIEDAKRIGLADKDTWKKYPRAMLRSRVVSEGIRTVYPGAIVGVYTPEEVQDMEPRLISPEPPEILDRSDNIDEASWFPVMLPGAQEPYTRCPSVEIWIAEINDLVSRINNSSKIKDDEKSAKIDALRDANQQVIETLSTELRTGLGL